ncbi:MAG: hypothetical protein AB1478_09150 [Nitrospirota bacterium]
MTFREPIRVALCLLALFLFFSMIIIPEGADAQMRVVYPRRFRLTGLVELSYRDYSITSTYARTETKSGWAAFEQRYTLGLHGYIYHPRLAVFSTSVTFRDGKIKGKAGTTGEARDINYDLLTTFLPYRPISLDIYATKIDSTIEGWTTAPYDVSSNSYGTRLRITKRRLPTMRIEYDHWDYSSGLEPKKTETDRFGFSITGTLKAIRTRYTLGGDFLDYSGPIRSYKAQYIRGDMDTVIKNGDILRTAFQYSDDEVSKLFSFDANLELKPYRRFNHSYRYYQYAEEITKTATYNMMGTWGYRFTDRLNSTASLNYSLTEWDGMRSSSYALGASLNYRRPIADLDFTSHTRLSFRKDEIKGDFKDYSLGLGLATRKLRWGRIYTIYDFDYRVYDYTYKYKTLKKAVKTLEQETTEHRLRTGVSGRGPGRAYWTVETEGNFLDSTNGDSIAKGRAEQWAQKIRHYSLTGEAVYPIRRRGTATLKAGYTTGETNEREIERYYYEGRFNYPIFRNLSFLAWWREEWWSKGWWGNGWDGIEGRGYGMKTRDYQLDLYYTWRRLSLSLEYSVSKIGEGSITTEFKHLYMKLRRPF